MRRSGKRSPISSASRPMASARSRGRPSIRMTSQRIGPPGKLDADRFAARLPRNCALQRDCSALVSKRADEAWLSAGLAAGYVPELFDIYGFFISKPELAQSLKCTAIAVRHRRRHAGRTYRPNRQRRRPERRFRAPLGAAFLLADGGTRRAGIVPERKVSHERAEHDLDFGLGSGE